MSSTAAESVQIYARHPAECGVNQLGRFEPCTCGADKAQLMDMAIGTLLSTITDLQLVEIFSAVANGVGGHGSFLCRFADLVAQADRDNLTLLRPTALALVAKYNLALYQHAAARQRDANKRVCGE